MTRYIGLALATSAWGLLIFTLALRVHFPEEELIDRLRWEVQEASGGELVLEASGASPWHLIGVAVEDAALYRAVKPLRKRKGEEAPPPAPQLFLASQQVAVRLAPLALLTGRQEVVFDAALYQGELSGTVDLSETTTNIDAVASDIDLTNLPLSGKDWVVDASGTMQLDVDMALDRDAPKKSEGTITLAIDDFIISSGEVMGFAIDTPTAFTESTIKLETKKDKLEITEGSFVSEPVKITLDGYITLAKTLRRTRIRIGIKLKLSDTLDAFAKNIPSMKGARDEDGIYHFSVSGTPSNPHFREDRSAMRRSGSAAKSPRRQELEDRIQREEEGMSDDEKEALRAERLERMQDRMRRGGGAARVPSSIDGGRESFGPRRGIRPPGMEAPSALPRDFVTSEAFEDEEGFEDDMPLDEEGFEDDMPLDDEPLFDE